MLSQIKCLLEPLSSEMLACYRLRIWLIFNSKRGFTRSAYSGQNMEYSSLVQMCVDNRNCWFFFFLLLFDIFQSHKQFPLSRGIHYAHLGAQLSTLQSCMTDFQPNVHIAVGQKTEQKQEWKRAKARHFFYIQVIQVASSCKLNAFSRQARILMGS